MNRRRRPFQHRPDPAAGSAHGGGGSRDPRKALPSSGRAAHHQQTAHSHGATLPPSRRAPAAATASEATSEAGMAADEPWDPFSVTASDVENASGSSGSKDSIFTADNWNGGDASFGSGGAFGDGSFGGSAFDGPVAGEDSSWSNFRNVSASGGFGSRAKVVDWPSPQLSPIAQDDGSMEAETPAEEAGEISEPEVLISTSPEEPKQSERRESPRVNKAREIVRQRNRQRGLASPGFGRPDPMPSPASPGRAAGKRPLEPPAAAPVPTDAAPAKMGRSDHARTASASDPKGQSNEQSRASAATPPSAPAKPPTKSGSLDAWHARQERRQFQQRPSRGREPGSVVTSNSVLTDEMSEAQLARRKGKPLPSTWEGQIAARQRQMLEPSPSKMRNGRKSRPEIAPKDAVQPNVRRKGEAESTPQPAAGVPPPTVHPHDGPMFAFTRDEARLPRYGHLARRGAEAPPQKPVAAGKALEQGEEDSGTWALDDTFSSGAVPDEAPFLVGEPTLSWDLPEEMKPPPTPPRTTARNDGKTREAADAPSANNDPAGGAPSNDEHRRHVHAIRSRRLLWGGHLLSSQPPQPAEEPSDEEEEKLSEFDPDDMQLSPPRPRRTEREVPRQRLENGGGPNHDVTGATRGLVMGGLVESSLQEATWTSPQRPPSAPLSTRGIYRRTHPSVRWPPPHPARRPAHASATVGRASSDAAGLRRQFSGPSPTGIADATIVRLPPVQKGSPTRSDHSADAAAGAKFFGAAGLRDVRRRIFAQGEDPPTSDGGEDGAVAEGDEGARKARTVREVLRDDDADLDLRNAQALYRSSDRRDSLSVVPEIALNVSWDDEHNGSASPKRHAASIFKQDAATSPMSIARKVSWDDESIPQPKLDAKLSKVGLARSFDSACHHSAANMSMGSSALSSRHPTSGARSVASAQHSVETECVRQNAEIAIAMGDMMDFFLAAEKGDGDGTEGDSLSIEGQGLGDGDYWEPASPDSWGDGQLESLAEEEEAPFDVEADRRLEEQEQDVGPENELASRSLDEGQPIKTPMRSNHRQVANTLSNLVLFPSPSEEYDDPSVFANSIVSDSSSELTPAQIQPRPAPAAAEAARNRDSLGFPISNNNNNKAKDLSNFLDQFSDRILHGCHDGEGESSDVFFVNNSQFGSSQFGSGNPSLEEEEVADPVVFQKPQRALRSSALPPASTFLSAKDRARIRRHDTTPRRANTTRARRGAMGSQRSLFSYHSEASMHSIKEDDGESQDSTVDDEQSSDYTAYSGSERSGQDVSRDAVSSDDVPSDDVSSEDESDTAVQSSASSDDLPHQSPGEGKSTVDSASKDGDINGFFKEKEEADSPPPPPSLQRSKLEPLCEEKKDDPPPAETSYSDYDPDHDMMKMTYREKRKGHSLAWHSSNGVNEDELYDSKQLPPSRAKRASTLAGRLNLLSISSLTAGTFREHFSDDDNSSHNPLYNPSLAHDEQFADPRLGSIQEEGFENSDGDESLLDEEDASERRHDEYTHDSFLRDFKDIILRAGLAEENSRGITLPAGKNQSGTGAVETPDVKRKDVSPKRQHQPPVKTTGADRAAGGYEPSPRKVPNQHQRTKTSTGRENPSMAVASHPSPPPVRYQMRHDPVVQRKAPVRARGGVPPLHRQTRPNYHPHHVPKGKELTKSRLEEKLLGISGGVARKYDGESVGTSELGSLLTRDSERSQIGNVGVPTMIFHRTHPGVQATKQSPESCRSSPSSMQNTYNGSVSGGVRTPKGHVLVPRNRIFLPDDMTDDAAAAQDASQFQRPVAGPSPAVPPTATRNPKQEHFQAAAAAIAKIDEELRNSNRQKLPAFPPAVTKTSRPPSTLPQAAATGDSNVVGSGSKAVAIEINRVHSEPNQVAANVPAGSLPKGLEMQRSRSARVGSGTAMNKPVRQSNAIEVKAPPSLGKVQSTGGMNAQTTSRISHSAGNKQFGVEATVTSRRDSNSNAATRALFLATSSSTLHAQNLSSQKPQIPPSFNSSHNLRRNMVTPDNISQHSSIFEAFEVAPLRTFSDDADDGDDAHAFLEHVGVHHSFTRKGSKRVGFPMTREAIMEEKAEVDHPLEDAYPFRSRDSVSNGQRARSQGNSASNETEGFEVILPKPVPRPPPPPPTTNRKEQGHRSQLQGTSQRDRIKRRIRSGWKRMVPHGGTSLATPNHGTTAVSAKTNKVGSRAMAKAKRGGRDPPGSLAR